MSEWEKRAEKVYEAWESSEQGYIEEIKSNAFYYGFTAGRADLLAELTPVRETLEGLKKYSPDVFCLYGLRDALSILNEIFGEGS